MKRIFAILFLFPAICLAAWNQSTLPGVIITSATTPSQATGSNSFTLASTSTGSPMIITASGSFAISSGGGGTGTVVNIAGSGTTSGLNLSGTITTSGTLILSGSVTKANVGLGNVSNTASAGTFSIGDGSITFGSAGQISASSNPTNLFLTSSTLSALQLSNTVPIANLPSSLVVSASNGLVITGGTVALNTLASGTETLGGTLKVTNAVLTGTLGTNATNLQINAAGQTITMNCAFLAFTELYGNQWAVPSGSYQFVSNGNINLQGNTNIVWSSAGYGLAGTTGTTNANAGNVGEYIVSSVVQGSAAALTTATPLTIASVVLTAGDWDVTGIGAITGASTGTEFDVAVSATTNTLSGTVLGNTRCQTPTVSLAGADATLMIPDVRVTLASSGTYYLIIQETFTVGSPGGYGRISARRRR